MKEKANFISVAHKKCNQALRIMKISVLLTVLCTLSVFAEEVHSQQLTVTVNMRNTSIRKVISQIERNSDYVFIVSGEAGKSLDRRVNISAEKESMSNIMDIILQNTDLGYRIVERQVSVFKKENQLRAAAQIQQPPHTINVRGVVTDADKEPLPGVSIRIKGTSQGIATDADGSFVLQNISPRAVLEITYVGMQSQTIAINGRTLIHIYLEEDRAALEEIVVTGYQTLSKERATGSFDVLDSEQLNKPSTSLEQSIIGNISGIQIIDRGYRDREESIIIRGLTSLGANSNPLVIVDGFAIEGALSSINPNDIESITVLKDAAAASIWGARSANGVIVVTTKSAKSGKVNVELNSFIRVSGKMDLDYANPLASAAETVEYEKMGFDSNFFTRGTLLANNYSSAIYDFHSRVYSQAVVAMNENRLGFLQGSLTNELARLSALDNRQQIRDYLLSRPVAQQYNLSVSGGSGNLSNVLTLMFDKNESPFKGTDDQRYTLNYRTNLSLFKWLDMSVSTMFQYNNAYSNGVTLAEIQAMSPYDMLLGENDEYLHVPKDLYLPVVQRYITDRGVEFPYGDWTYNPLREMRGRDINNRTSYGRIQAGLKFKIMDGLSFDSKYQYEIMDSKNKSLYSEDTYQIRFNVNYNSQWNGNAATPVQQNVAEGMAIAEGSYALNAWNFRNQLNFDRTFNEKHLLSLVAGTEVSKRVYQTTSYPLMYGYNDELLSITPPLNGISTPTNPIYNMFGGTSYYFTGLSYPSATRSYTVDKYISVYANAAYTIDGKYTLSGSYRTDASNLISSDPSIRYSPFWSAGLSWQIGREQFMENVSWVNRLIVRSTYGFNGNVDKSTSVDPLISIWFQNPTYGTGYGIISNYGNPYLSWERTGAFNIGIDFALLNNKLFGKIDYYDKRGNDLISMVAIANVYGTDTQRINAVSMYNRGIELSVGSRLQYNDFRWTGNLTFAYNRNKITKLFKDKATLANRVYGPGSGWEYAEGYDAGTLWAFKYGGMQEAGGVLQPVIVDKNGENPRGMTSYNTSFDTSDYLMDAGTAMPPVVTGLNSSFGYRNVDLSFIVTGYFGHKFKRTGFNYPSMSRGVGNINKYYDEIKNADPDEFVPLPINGMYPGQLSGYVNLLDNLIVNAANIRFQEVNLTYRMPQTVTSRLGIGGLSLYTQLNNVGVITFNGYGQDPFYPMGTYKPRVSYTFGTKINF